MYFIFFLFCFEGEVENISRMKAKGETPHETGLLEYLEEIIGTDKFIADIQKLQAIDVDLHDKCSIELARLRAAEAARDELSVTCRAIFACPTERQKILKKKKPLLLNHNTNLFTSSHQFCFLSARCSKEFLLCNSGG